MRLKGKVVLVTGAAGGVGAATARLSAAEGARHVYVADVHDDAAEVVESIRRKGASATRLVLDVTDDAAWAQVVERVESAGDGMHVLVNNAGISGSSSEDAYEIEAWNRLIEVNATGAFLGMRHCVPLLERTGPGGAVVNVASISALIGQGYLHVGYGASKAAVRQLSKAAAAHHGRAGIRVNTVFPGMLPPMRTTGRTADPAMRAAALERVPLGRAGEVDEVARAIVFLASEDASYITGAELVVDGGWTAV
jgi:NAD(P)-dependent dehydrogenase (short-subunit alcohol dehydrogenase family)